LDATTTRDTALAVLDDGVVNGPEDGCVDWQTIGWSKVEQDVQRLRQRIFTASREGMTRNALEACLSRLPGKRARPVLRGPRRSNAPGLPDVRHEVA
jgi:hypothetical protein